MATATAATSGATAGSLSSQDPTQAQTSMRAEKSTNNGVASNTNNKEGSVAQPNKNRVSNTTICVPIVYGSIAFPLKKTEEYNTHRWTLFLRGANNEDLADGIAKVVFQLHPSFAQPVRELTAPPFEVTEKGWGEFEASIRVVWRDPTEKALVLTHFIKLYPPIESSSGSNKNASGAGGSGRGGSTASSTAEKKDSEPEPVISQFYDEVVFTDPNDTFHRQLLHGSVPKTIDHERNRRFIKSQEPSVQKYYDQPIFSDDSDFKILLEAQKFLEEELVSVKDRILRADASKAELENALMEVSNKAKAVAAQAAAAQAATNAATAASTSTGTKRKSKSSGGSSKKAKSSSSKKQSSSSNATSSSNTGTTNKNAKSSAVTSSAKSTNTGASASANTSVNPKSGTPIKGKT